MTTWRLRDLVVDGVRNVTGSPVRSALLALAAAGTVGALVFADLSTTENLLEFEGRFAASGGNVVVAYNDQGLDTGRCATMSGTPGVVRAGGIQPGQPVETAQAPGTLFQTATVSAGALSLLTNGMGPRVAQVADGLIVGSVSAAELGLEEGMWLHLDSTNPHRVGAVVDVEMRDPQASRWILSVGPPVGTSTECWVEYAPGARTGRNELLETVFAGSGEQLAVRPLIRLDEFSRNPVAELVSRPQAEAWIVAGLLLGGLGWLSAWFRRSHIGLYRAVGTGPAALLILGAVEHAIPLVVGASAGALWTTAGWAAVTSSFPAPDQLTIAARTATSTVLLAIAASPMLWLLVARGSVAQQLKER